MLQEEYMHTRRIQAKKANLEGCDRCYAGDVIHGIQSSVYKTMIRKHKEASYCCPL